jgi:hypothetical protein
VSCKVVYLTQFIVNSIEWLPPAFTLVSSSVYSTLKLEAVCCLAMGLYVAVFNTFKHETHLNYILEFSLCPKEKKLRLNYRILKMLCEEIKRQR